MWDDSSDSDFERKPTAGKKYSKTKPAKNIDDLFGDDTPAISKVNSPIADSSGKAAKPSYLPTTQPEQKRNYLSNFTATSGDFEDSILGELLGGIDSNPGKVNRGIPDCLLPAGRKIKLLHLSHDDDDETVATTEQKASCATTKTTQTKQHSEKVKMSSSQRSLTSSQLHSTDSSRIDSQTAVCIDENNSNQVFLGSVGSVARNVVAIKTNCSPYKINSDWDSTPRMQFRSSSLKIEAPVDSFFNTTPTPRASKPTTPVAKAQKLVEIDEREVLMNFLSDMGLAEYEQYFTSNSRR